MSQLEERNQLEHDIKTLHVRTPPFPLHTHHPPSNTPQNSRKSSTTKNSNVNVSAQAGTTTHTRSVPVLLCMLRITRSPSQAQLPNSPTHTPFQRKIEDLQSTLNRPIKEDIAFPILRSTSSSSTSYSSSSASRSRTTSLRSSYSIPPPTPTLTPTPPVTPGPSRYSASFVDCIELDGLPRSLGFGDPNSNSSSKPLDAKSFWDITDRHLDSANDDLPPRPSTPTPL